VTDVQFSIIIPTYNRSKFIATAINSVKEQTYQNWELLVVDDGSTDDTKDMIQEFSEQDNRIIYIYQKNQERSAARNHGINRAKSEYICFLDSDDLFEPNHLACINNRLNKDNYKFKVYFTLKKIKSADGEILLQSSNYYYENTFTLLLKEMIHCQQMCIHKSVFEQHKFNNQLNVGEDIELWFRIAESFSFNKINEFTIIINDHSQRTVSITNEKTYILFKQLMHKLIRKYRNKVPIKERQNCLSGVHFNLAKHYFLKRKTLNLIQQIIVSSFYKPKPSHLKKTIYLLYLYVNKKNLS